MAKKALLKWGTHSARKNEGVCGYPSTCISFSLVARSDRVNEAFSVDDEVMQTDSIMCQMKLHKPDLYRVGVGWYVHNLPVSTISRLERCHRDTVYRRLESLHRSVAEAFVKNQSVPV
ncbi:MAG: hypothetical protein LBK01_00030 [Burkholderiaceae bacterium]|nr:hypothetical protein [Burkholderiaceae bacterium]